MKTKNVLPAVLTLVALVIAGCALSHPDAHEVALRKRAEALFEVDRKMPHLLPRASVSMLSISMEFGNYRGAEEVLKRLEPMVEDAHAEKGVKKAEADASVSLGDDTGFKVADRK